MPKKILERLQNTKARTFLVFGLVIFLIISVIIYFFVRRSTPLGTEASATERIPNITAIPGGVTSERYQQLQEEENRRRAEAAKEAGTSEVATIVGSRSKDALSSKESFGIEDLLKKECRCPPTIAAAGTVPELDAARAAALIAEIEANPDRALALLRQNPGLGKALCTQKPELAMQVMEKDIEAAKIILNECPELAKAFAEKNPALFKKLMLENPELAKKLAAANPELFKKLMLEDPEFARQMSKTNPELLKDLLKNDPDFADKFGAQHPDIIKDLMKNDPAFAKTIMKNNPALVKKLMLEDPEFARILAQNNPDDVKDLMINDPEFARKLAETNPTLVKELMKNDPAFARLMAEQNPDMVKKLMLDDPEFAKIMARNDPDMVNKLMQDDPVFAKALRDKNPGIDNLLQRATPTPTPVAVTDQAKLLAAEEALKKQREAQAAEQLQLKLTEAQQKQLQEIMNNMEGQAKSMFQAWNEFNPQQFVQGEWASKEKEVVKEGVTMVSDGRGGMVEVERGPKPAMFKAGTIIFAVLDTTISSDEPGPILATIVEGKYRGSKLVGTFTAAPQPGGLPAEKVILNFNIMNIPSAPNSISIQAVAIDPDTARTALATDVDHHYLLRYGTIFASSFLVGYSKVLTQQGTVQTTSANGLSTTTTAAQLNPREKVMAALGEVGKKLGESWKKYADIPPTITVESGTGLGILFLADVTG